MSADFIRKRGAQNRKHSVWHWEGISDDEDAVWADHSDDEIDDDDENSCEGKERITFGDFCRIQLLLKACKNDEELLLAALDRISRTHGQVVNIFRLIQLVKESPLVTEEGVEFFPFEPFDREDLVLINLAYPPRRSDLYSLIKVLTRIECLGQICAWTKLSNPGVRRPNDHVGLEFGCPPLDFIELPRLKLVFTARLDHDGVRRLYSVDHGDLFITSDKSEMTEKMLSGIPHSLLLTNVKGETQVLVPVVPPMRPIIKAEPFSTFTVLSHVEVFNQFLCFSVKTKQHQRCTKF